FRKPFTLGPQRDDLIGDVQHVPGSFNLVIAALYLDADGFFQPLQVFLGLSKFGLAFANLGAPLSEVEHIVGHVYTERSEIVDYERNSILIALPSNRRDIRNVSGLRGLYPGLCLLYGFGRNENLRVRRPRLSRIFFARALFENGYIDRTQIE